MTLPATHPVGPAGEKQRAMQIGRLLRTVWWLRPQQVAGQLALRGRRWLPRAAPPTDAPEVPGVRWAHTGPFLPPGAAHADRDQLLAGEFEFLNQRSHLGWPPSWSPPTATHLWQYNLHYFEYLWRLDFDDALEIAIDWVHDNPSTGRGCGWEPYPTSLRLQNWVGYFWSGYYGELAPDSDPADVLWRSLFQQAEWLSRRMETHLLGNHLWENGVALAMVGACFNGRHAERWLRMGLDVLERQIPEQVLPDGGHFERSPMYHLRALYTLALLANTGDDQIRSLVLGPLAEMADALRAFLHPDGEIALLNDSAPGVQNSPRDVLAFCAAVSEDHPSPARSTLAENAGVGGFRLASTGYYGWRSSASSRADYVICDAAPVGPDYLPGHAHGDMFSFELSLDGRRVITDTGVHDYEVSAARSVCRSTRAHNTVEVNGQDQCEFWGAFRVGRRGRPLNVKYHADEGGFRLSGQHDGYRHLPGRPLHRREFVWRASGTLMVRDSVRLSGDHGSASCLSSLHFAPGLQLESRDDCFRVWDEHGEFYVRFDAGERGRLELEESVYHPGMNLCLARACLRLSWSSPAERHTGFVISRKPPAAFSASQGVVFPEEAIDF